MDWNTSIYCGINGQIVGPVSLREFKQAVDQGQVPQDALVCREANEGWLPVEAALDRIAEDFPTFWHAAKQPPPLPSVAAEAAPALASTQTAMADPPPTSQAAQYHETKQSHLACPQCGSEQIARAGVIYSQGTSTSYQGPTHYGVDDMGEIHEFGGGTVSHSSDLARQLAPPQGIPLGCLWPLFLGGCFATFVLILFLPSWDIISKNWVYLVATGGVLFLVGIWTLHRIFVHIPELQKYHRTWYCFRCGSSWLQ